jgi:pSer/pThr/pTyr-binding forkhead associated (FHA) protein
MQIVLVIFRAGADTQSVSIVQDMTVIGRREECDLRIGILDISRKHCRLIRDFDALRIEDLGSSNGTYVNGVRIREATLAAGDRIQIGPVTLIVQIDGQPPEDEMEPGPPPPMDLTDDALTGTSAAVPAPPEDEFAIENDQDQPEDDLVDFNLDQPPEA